jgi:hypothetical protein
MGIFYAKGRGLGSAPCGMVMSAGASVFRRREMVVPDNFPPFAGYHHPVF